MLRNERVQAVSRLLWRIQPHQRNAYTRREVWDQDKRMVKRIASSQITVADADFKTTGVKKAQNWKYPGGVIQRHPNLIINGTEYTDPKELPERLPRRKQESNFFITLNTNRAPRHYPAVSDAAWTAMQKALEHMKDESVICACLKFGPKDSTYVGDKYADVIHKVEWKAGVETGDTLERLHAHIWLTITHYSQIQINPQMTQHIFKEEYNRHAPKDLKISGLPYIQVKLLPQSDFTTIMKQYMHKGMTS